jgi:hypothetical protein
VAGTLVKQEVIGSKEVKELMKAMRWDEARALGCLVLLWNGSQNRGMSRAPGSLIAQWCGVKEKDRERLLEALASEKCGFLKHVRNRLGTFEIVGNKHQVRKLRELKELRARGGRTTKEKFAKPKAQANPTLDAEVKKDPIPCPVLPFPAMPFPSPPRTSPHDPAQLDLLGEPKGGGAERLASSGGSGTRRTDHLEEAVRQLEAAGMLDSDAYERLALKWGAERVRKAIDAARSAT